MKLIPNENLSPRLVQRLASLFPGILHVRDVGLKQASDEDIWKWARENARTIVTTDNDFVTLNQRLGWPPKVIHLKQCDAPFLVIDELLRQNAIRISEFDKDMSVGLLIVRSQRGNYHR